jgi:hypothetical protein
MGNMRNANKNFISKRRRRRRRRRRSHVEDLGVDVRKNSVDVRDVEDRVRLLFSSLVRGPNGWILSNMEMDA